MGCGNTNVGHFVVQRANLILVRVCFLCSLSCTVISVCECALWVCWKIVCCERNPDCCTPEICCGLLFDCCGLLFDSTACCTPTTPHHPNLALWSGSAKWLKTCHHKDNGRDSTMNPADTSTTDATQLKAPHTVSIFWWWGRLHPWSTVLPSAPAHGGPCSSWLAGSSVHWRARPSRKFCPWEQRTSTSLAGFSPS